MPKGTSALSVTPPPTQMRTCGSNGQPISVTWPPATTKGGRNPVTVTYSPAQGSAFAVGATTVSVKASSRDKQTATASFQVIVSVPVAVPPDYPPSDLTAVEV